LPACRSPGFRAVISPRFGDIFRNNAGNVGLLAISTDASIVSHLQDLIEADPSTPITVDLMNREVRAPGHAHDTEVAVPFAIDDYARWRLMEGLDDIDLALRHSAEIANYEKSRPSWMPTAG
jgi:3-isopropylmalate/(R)-2-methylmalate dehydratase small subunit